MSISAISAPVAPAVQVPSQTHPSTGREVPARRSDTTPAQSKNLLAPSSIQANSTPAPKSLAVQALEESTETAAETAMEARAGDPQARRLERKLAAAKSNATAAPPSGAPHATGTGVGSLVDIKA